jgi:hypothetical protein
LTALLFISKLIVKLILSIVSGILLATSLILAGISGILPLIRIMLGVQFSIMGFIGVFGSIMAQFGNIEYLDFFGGITLIEFLLLVVTLIIGLSLLFLPYISLGLGKFHVFVSTQAKRIGLFSSGFFNEIEE